MSYNISLGFKKLMDSTQRDFGPVKLETQSFLGGFAPVGFKTKNGGSNQAKAHTCDSSIKLYKFINSSFMSNTI